MNKQFITKNFLLIVMLLAVAIAVAMKTTVFQRGMLQPKAAGNVVSATSTSVVHIADSLTVNKPKP